MALPPMTTRKASTQNDAAVPSADVASPKAVAELLVLDEHARLNKLAGLFLLLLPIAALSLLLFDGEPVATRVFAAMLGVGFVATGVQFYLTKAPGRFRLGIVTGLITLQMLTVIAATAYFGVFSPAALVAVLVAFFLALGNYTVLAVVTWSVSAVGRLVLMALIATGTLADPGLIDGEGLTGIQMIAIEVLVQSVLAIAFVAGRMTRRSTATKVTWLLEVVRRAARRELDIASRIQMQILPRDVDIPCFEIAANMIPASEVGGDYYDLRPTEDGCWIGIGDVSGHGLTAGLIMMMVQTAVAALTDGRRSLTEIIEGVNRVVHANVRKRLRKDDFVTFSLLRCMHDGRVVAAGRHEPILVHRAKTGAVELHDPTGLWLGMRPMLGESLVPVELTMLPGDTMVLHTDGVTEAGNAERERYGFKRLVEELERHAALPVDELRKVIERGVVEFSAPQTDDITLVVIRYVGA